MTSEEFKTMIEDGLEANMNFLANMDTGIFYATISTAIVEYLHRNPSVDWERLAGKLVENIITAPAMVVAMYGKE